eukprot:CAMPEP_0197671234 /NCGR_PEP_ID=MMETSP1338-20131121/76267_1 /TAXON_ID=43686 ORGANISM="Pelagodinium beii, Strain RCC1491" /NCGR_SAMPLE_ID=MMETSP1338 /ASSEMBLY_ACC=CAM_ASM_000754 /LENGTH=136 /DNA_ID=CAMNT_0043251093 /DNA_START=92 /DNA_END=499 /DNA_ORIENTATION=-
MAGKNLCRHTSDFPAVEGFHLVLNLLFRPLVNVNFYVPVHFLEVVAVLGYELLQNGYFVLVDFQWMSTFLGDLLRQNVFVHLLQIRCLKILLQRLGFVESLFEFLVPDQTNVQVLSLYNLLFRLSGIDLGISSLPQ